MEKKRQRAAEDTAVEQSNDAAMPHDFADDYQASAGDIGRSGLALFLQGGTGGV